MPHHTPHGATPVIQLRGVSKHYPAAGGTFAALNALTLHIDRGEFVAVTGASGSGKSTLLNLLGGIDRPSSGELMVDGQPLHRFSEAQLTAWRGSHVGIVFQFFQLLPTLTAIENVMLPMDLCRQWPFAQRRRRAMDLLQRLGIADQADKFPVALSGGQQQRVALARALANEPPLLLADEPTGNLDSHNARALLHILSSLVRDDGLTLVMVTHEAEAQREARRTLTLSDGKLVHDSAADGPRHGREDGAVQQADARSEPSHA